MDREEGTAQGKTMTGKSGKVREGKTSMLDSGSSKRCEGPRLTIALDFESLKHDLHLPSKISCLLLPENLRDAVDTAFEVTAKGAERQI